MVDTGVGISNSQRKVLLRRKHSHTDHPEHFRQILDWPNYAKSKQATRGLRLRTCQEIVRRCGGELTVVSKRNQGTTFSFTMKAEVKGCLRHIGAFKHI